MNWYLEVLRKYAVFSGRARRKEYWTFTLINILISIVIGFIDQLIGIKVLHIGLLGLLYSLAVLIPSIAVGFRRLHDTGRSGWWVLIGLIPILGWLVLIIFTIQDSEPQENEYGPNPKQVRPPT